jgi:thymidylate synthase
MKRIEDIRQMFIDKLKNEDFVIDKSGVKTIEIIGASFIADEEVIFGEVNKEYVDAEIEWYKSKSTNINKLAEIYGKSPVAWQYSANKYGEINSNYGTLIFSDKYYNQFEKVLAELLKNPDSRRAQLIYNRPSIWVEFNEDNKNDFICTNAQTFYIRDNKLHLVSQMRSNDSCYGYKNDFQWAKYLMNEMVNRYNTETEFEKIQEGDIIWQVMNLHVYEKHFSLVK